MRNSTSISNSTHLVSTISPDLSSIPRQRRSSSGSNPLETILLRVRHTQRLFFYYKALSFFSLSLSHNVFLFLFLVWLFYSAFSPKCNWKLEPLKQITNIISETKPVEISKPVIESGLNRKDQYNGTNDDDSSFYTWFCVNSLLRGFNLKCVFLVFRVHLL